MASSASPLSCVPLGVGEDETELYYPAALALRMSGAWLFLDCPRPVRRVLREMGPTSGLRTDAAFGPIVLARGGLGGLGAIEACAERARASFDRALPVVAHPEVIAHIEASIAAARAPAGGAVGRARRSSPARRSAGGGAAAKGAARARHGAIVTTSARRKKPKGAARRTTAATAGAAPARDAPAARDASAARGAAAAENASPAPNAAVKGYAGVDPARGGGGPAIGAPAALAGPAYAAGVKSNLVGGPAAGPEGEGRRAVGASQHGDGAAALRVRRAMAERQGSAESGGAGGPAGEAAAVEAAGLGGARVAGVGSAAGASARAAPGMEAEAGAAESALPAGGVLSALEAKGLIRVSLLAEGRLLRQGPFTVECRPTSAAGVTALMVRTAGASVAYCPAPVEDRALLQWLGEAELVVIGTPGSAPEVDAMARLAPSLRERLRLIAYDDDYPVYESAIEPLIQGRRYNL